MKFVIAAMVVVALGASGCGVCAIYCASIQKIVFEDASGNPLAPLQVTDGQTTHRCDPTDAGVTDPFVTCDGNSLSYDMRSLAPHTIRAEARTGEVFSGQITPVTRPTARPAGSCGCGGSTLDPITVRLTAP